MGTEKNNIRLQKWQQNVPISKVRLKKPSRRRPKPKLYLMVFIIFMGFVTILIYQRDLGIYERAKRQANKALSYFYIEAKPVSAVIKMGKNDPIDLHRKSALLFGVPILKNDADIKNKLQTGELVNVKNNRGYQINKLTHSKAVLVPEAYDILKDIGKSFKERANDGDFFVVTSLTRTIEDQKRLRRSNSNATNGISTHCYGCSFDISYVRFNQKRGTNKELQNILEGVLATFQKEGKILVIVEKKIRCYHITIRK